MTVELWEVQKAEVRDGGCLALKMAGLNVIAWHFIGMKIVLGRWVFPKIGVKPPKWMVFIMENPVRMDDLGVPLFSETSR